MTNLKKILAGALIISSTMSFMGCGFVAQTPEARLATVVAKVSGTDITVANVNELLQYDINWLTEEYGENYEKDMPDDMKETWEAAKENALKQLIDEKLILNKAESMGVSFTDEEMAAAIETERANYLEYYGGEEGLQKQLDTYGYTDEYFEELLKKQIIVNKVVDLIIGDITVTDEELQKYYDENKAEFTTNPGLAVKHILYPTLEEAEKAKADIDANNNFDTLYENFKGNTYAEGVTISEDLGFIEYDSTEFVADFMTGIKDLKENEVSAPIKTEFGYHIVKAVSVSTEPVVADFETVKESIHSFLEHDKQNKAYESKMEEWKKELNVKTYEDKL